MATLVLDLKKSVEENASDYFEKAKKTKKKIKGAEEALQQSIRKLNELGAKKEKFEAEENKKAVLTQRKKEWYEKFRWFISSDGFLVVGGRDATSNEVVVKKHTNNDDLVLHTDMAGSPFFVIKAEGKKIPETTIMEAADATCTFSRVWKLGLQTSDVFYVSPEQVSKKTKAGEYMGKGAFMVYGKSNYVENKINLAVGIAKEKAIMAGPLEAIKKNCEKYVVLMPGDEKSSAIAKKINYKLGGNLDLDEIIRALPAGEFSFK
ncbi:MAG: NFACT RNA binding domain-containing protein [Nanoarchaeota archaeon]|nr:NFACT RNA binding domain-containing protein [Nanoarchaeota archaeon]